MIENNDDDIYHTAIANYGEPAQVLKAIEEMAEAISELCKLIYIHPVNRDEINIIDNIERRCYMIWEDIQDIKPDKIILKEGDYTNLKSECADVENMLNQLRIMFGSWDEEKKMKLDRTMERINNEKNQ